MASEKALYWMAVGLVALVAGNHFVERFDGRGLAERSMAAVEWLSGGPAFEAILGNASARCARARASIEQAQGRMASVQAGFASAQTMMARQNAACARLQAEEARLMAMQQMQHMQVQVLANRGNFRVEIPEIAIPQVRVNVGDGRL